MNDEQFRIIRDCETILRSI